MKHFFVSFLKYHFLPLAIAAGLAFFCLFFYANFKSKDAVQTEVISAKQTMFQGTLGNFDTGAQAEIELAAALKDQNIISIFGSSELGTMAYSPYYFLLDSLNMPTVAFGHAHHQHFSMFCELLAMKKELKKSKICIIISPSWFETEGTNIEAFLEFVRPNFIKSIIHNDEISLDFKMEIGKFISDHFRDIENPSEYLYYFKNLYEYRNIPMLNKLMQNSTKGVKNADYQFEKGISVPKEIKAIDWKKTAKLLQKNFLDSNENNPIFVNNGYYTEYLLKDGVYKNGNTDPIVHSSKNREYQDFLLLMKVLKENNCDATFIIQPLNPYHYKDLDNYNEVINKVRKEIEKNNFKYLDLFTTDPKKYEPATLNDIMHLGDYGWLKINKFLFENYKAK